MFFFDPRYEGVLFSRDPLFLGKYGENVFGTNVIVHVSGDEITTLGDVTSWIDIRGHIHTIATLKAQIEFNRWLNHQPSCANGCDLTIGRDDPLHISPVPETGIMDRQTLGLPLTKFEIRYDAVYRSYLAQCGSQGQSCNSELASEWKGALADAREQLDVYRARMSHAPFTRPNFAQLGDTLPKHESGWSPSGLTGLQLSNPDCIQCSDDRGRLLYYTDGVKGFRPASDEPEMDVDESLNPGTADPDKFSTAYLINSVTAEAAITKAEILDPRADIH